MAGDDHPRKKVVAAGESSKGKEKIVIVESSEIQDEKTDSLPPPTAAISIEEVPPVKKSKMVNVGDSSSAAAAVPPPLFQVPCPLCDRVFDSYPAMFGHQRVHKERTYRGAYPPPTFNREGTQSPPEEAARRAAEMLLDMSKGMFEQVSPVTAGFAVDLNIPLDMEKAADEEEEKGRRLDLNKTPPPSSGSE